MWFMGVLIVFGSGFGYIGSSFFPFDQYVGVTAPVAGLAFGAGLILAGFDPIANVSWVRALLLYVVFEIVWQIFDQVSIGRFDIVAFVIALIIGVLILVLYPNKPALWMQTGKTSGARA
jgi:hypothetical protein